MFNIADAALVIGAILLGIYVLFIYKEKDGRSVLALRRKRDEDEAGGEKDIEEEQEEKDAVKKGAKKKTSKSK